MMSSKLRLLLLLTFLTLQVASSSSRWKCICFKSKKRPTTFKNQAVNNPSESTLPVNNQLINNPNEFPLQNDSTSVSRLHPQEYKQMKDTKRLPTETLFQKMRWFQCWMLRSQRKVSDHITRLILSYLTVMPATSQLCPYSSGSIDFAISRDSRWLLSTAYDNSLHLSDLATGERFRTFMAPTHLATEERFRHLWSCAIADNHSFVAASGWENIYVWNTSSEKLVATLIGHKNGVFTCSIFFNDTRLASGGCDQIVRVWQVENLQWKGLYELKGHTDIIMSIFCLADNPQIISFAGRDDKTLRVWDSNTGKCLQILTGHTKPPAKYSCVMSLDHRLVGSISTWGDETKLWDITTGTCTSTILNISETEDWDHHIVYLSSQRLVWWHSYPYPSYRKGSQVGVENLLAKENVYTLLFDLEVRIKFVSVSADDKYLIIILNNYDIEDAFVQVFDFETGDLIESQEQKSFYN